MPAKNSVKIYLENSYYHVYNRGVSKSKIFLDDQDYDVFLHYLEKYLDPYSQHSFATEVKLLAYCLMPNHFHLFIYQSTRHGIIKFMRALSTSYVMYFNKRYDRSGTLFQGIYKAANIESEPYFLHLSRYIHLNPKGLSDSWKEYPYSSYNAYLEDNKTSWIDTSHVLNFFKQVKENDDSYSKYFSYKSFVEDYDSESEGILGEATID